MYEPSGSGLAYSADGVAWTNLAALVPEVSDFRQVYQVAIGTETVVIWGGDGGESYQDTWLLLGTP